MDRTVDRTVIDRNTVPNLRKPYKIRWCIVITVPYRITVNRTLHRRVTTLNAVEEDIIETLPRSRMITVPFFRGCH
jgi:hypothetical protein